MRIKPNQFFSPRIEGGRRKELVWKTTEYMTADSCLVRHEMFEKQKRQNG